jgi:hypothetical protein
MSKFEDILEPDTWYTSAELREFDGVVRHDSYNAMQSGELVSKPNPKGGRAKLYALPPSTNTRLATSTYDPEGADELRAELTSVRSERDVAHRSCNRLRHKIDRMREADTVAAQDAQELRERLEKMLHEHPLSSLVIESQYARADLAQWVGVFLDVAHQRIYELEEALDRSNGGAVLRQAPEFSPGGDVDVLVEACWKVLTGRAGDTTTIAAALQSFYQGDQGAA